LTIKPNVDTRLDRLLSVHCVQPTFIAIMEFTKLPSKAQTSQ